MKNLIRRIAHRSAEQLTRIAAMLALVGLAIMAVSIVSPRPVPVILAMSVGHVVGALALLCYLLAVVLHSARRPVSPEVPAPGLEPSERQGKDEDRAG